MITLTEVQRKTRMRDPEQEVDLQAVIDETLPVVLGKLGPHDSTDATVVATVKLGVLEVVSGKALIEFANEEDQDSFSIADMKFSETNQSGTRQKRGKELEASGWNMLAPYLKSEASSNSAEGFFDFRVM